MGYRKFQTENADYVLQAGEHNLRNTHNCFEGIDALVLETGGTELSQFLIPTYLEMHYKKHPQRALSVNHCREKGIPIFMTDNTNTPLGLTRGNLNFLFEMSLYPLMNYCSKPSRKIDDFSSRAIASVSFIAQNPFGTGRDALNARKIEEFVAPKVKEITGKDKPKIGLVFAVGHIGLEYDLKSKTRRDMTLWNWRNLNFKKYAGFDVNGLNKVYEARFDGLGWWKCIEHMTNLFH